MKIIHWSQSIIRSRLTGFGAEHLMPLLFVLLQGLLVAANLVVGRALLIQLPPLLFRLVQFAISSLILLAIPVIRRDMRLPTRPGLWLRAGFYGLIGTVVPLIGLILGMQYLSSGVMSLFMTMNPVLIILLAHYFLADERLTLSKMFGVLLAFSGAGLVLMRGESGLADVVQADPRGYIWGAVSMLSLSVSVIYARIYLQNESSFEVAAIRIISSAIIMVPIVMIDGNFDFSGVTLPGVGGVIFTAFGMVFAFWLGFIIIQRFGATTASLSSYVIPVFTLVLGAVFLGEQVTLTILAGVGLVYIGLRFLNR
jgi:drug/metabolite transporter (DMT)-like permease